MTRVELLRSALLDVESVAGCAAEVEPLLCELLFQAGESGDCVNDLLRRQHELADLLNPKPQNQ